jgi:hypothetical protein
MKDSKAVTWFRQIVVGLSPRSPGFGSHANLCEIYAGQSGTETSFSPSTSVFTCQYHSTNAPYPFIHLPPTLYNVFVPVLQFSPVSIIPPIFHTHSYIYHQRCIMLLSQYFSFPLSVSFHQCSILMSLISHLLSLNNPLKDVSIFPRPPYRMFYIILRTKWLFPWSVDTCDWYSMSTAK